MSVETVVVICPGGSAMLLMKISLGWDVIVFYNVGDSNFDRCVGARHITCIADGKRISNDIHKESINGGSITPSIMSKPCKAEERRREGKVAGSISSSLIGAMFKILNIKLHLFHEIK